MYKCNKKCSRKEPANPKPRMRKAKIGFADLSLEIESTDYLIKTHVCKCGMVEYQYPSGELPLQVTKPKTRRKLGGT